MTLDVTIGLVDIKKDEYSFILTVKRCPSAHEDICDSKFTRWPRESFRSGPIDFYDFFEENKTLSIMYEDSMDDDTLQLTKYIDDINKIDIDQFESEADKDRCIFIKYWSNKAIELYGDKAAIQFK